MAAYHKGEQMARELCAIMLDGVVEGWKAARLRLCLIGWLIGDAWRSFWQHMDARGRWAAWREVVDKRVQVG